MTVFILPRHQAVIYSPLVPPGLYHAPSAPPQPSYLRPRRSRPRPLDCRGRRRLRLAHVGLVPARPRHGSMDDRALHHPRITPHGGNPHLQHPRQLPPTHSLPLRNKEPVIRVRPHPAHRNQIIAPPENAGHPRSVPARHRNDGLGQSRQSSRNRAHPRQTHRHLQHLVPLPLCHWRPRHRR